MQLTVDVRLKAGFWMRCPMCGYEAFLAVNGEHLNQRPTVLLNCGRCGYASDGRLEARHPGHADGYCELTIA